MEEQGDSREIEQGNSTELGGHITLVGFREVDRAELVVVKKIVGSYTRKLSDTVPGFERIALTLKPIHKTDEGHPKFELHAKAIVSGKPVTAEVVERNLFVGLDDVLKKVLTMAEKA
ncbi:MAG TPA: hypothetical protein VJ461_00480 [Candidatus Nanoarchaeia archaeon]|nr:hypothetical protein [Candidatus Nanoarchaeia archaeon]